MASKKKRQPAPSKVRARTRRVGDEMVETVVTRRPAVIPFDDILEAVEVVPDEDCYDPPWEDCDGYEHDLVKCYDEYEPGRFADKARRGEDGRGPLAGGGYWIRHYNARHTFFRDSRNRHLIVISPAQVEKWGVRAYARAGGASKQVAAEREAEDLRRSYAQLRKWYVDGWEYWGVRGEYLDCQESVWRVGDYESADNECRLEIAGEIARQLEKLGYTVTGKPERTPEDRRAQLRAHCARNLGFASAADYRRWLAARPERGTDDGRQERQA